MTDRARQHAIQARLLALAEIEEKTGEPIDLGNERLVLMALDRPDFDVELTMRLLDDIIAIKRALRADDDTLVLGRVG